MVSQPYQPDRKDIPRETGSNARLMPAPGDAAISNVGFDSVRRIELDAKGLCAALTRIAGGAEAGLQPTLVHIIAPKSVTWRHNIWGNNPGEHQNVGECNEFLIYRNTARAIEAVSVDGTFKVEFASQMNYEIGTKQKVNALVQDWSDEIVLTGWSGSAFAELSFVFEHEPCGYQHFAKEVLV